MTPLASSFFVPKEGDTFSSSCLWRCKGLSWGPGGGPGQCSVPQRHGKIKTDLTRWLSVITYFYTLLLVPLQPKNVCIFPEVSIVSWGNQRVKEIKGSRLNMRWHIPSPFFKCEDKTFEWNPSFSLTKYTAKWQVLFHFFCKKPPFLRVCLSTYISMDKYIHTLFNGILDLYNGTPSCELIQFSSYKLKLCHVSFWLVSGNRSLA